MIDVLTCYAIAGISALLGLGLMWLIQTDQPRIQYALNVFRAAFLALSAMSFVLLAPVLEAPGLIKSAIGVAGMGVTLLGWAFRQLNGRRTPPWAGMALTGSAGLALAAGAMMSDVHYVWMVAVVFVVISVLMAIDQGLIIWGGSRWNAQDLTLLVVSLAFAGHWVVVLHHTWTVPGPFPADWLHAPHWLRPISGISFALLPLVVAALVFATINARLNQQLKARSLSDDLTGALSRRGLRELGERMLALQQGHASMVAVLMIDIDHFKSINDRYGHLVGDLVLKHVTHVVRDRLRDDALLARYGGEEFTVLLPVQHRQEARHVAERLRRAVESAPKETKFGPVRATVSIGVSFHSPESTLEEDLAVADQHLYAAKQAGRNRVECPDTESRFESRLESRFDAGQTTLQPPP